MNLVPTWKNAAYRQSLTTEAPANPIGEVELTDADLGAIYGAGGCGTSLLNGNNSHNDDGNINVLSGNNILNGASVLNNVGVAGNGSSNSYNQGSDCYRHQC